MAVDKTSSYYIQQTMHLDTLGGIWVSAQTLGSRLNFVKPHIHSAIEILYFMVGNCRVVINGVEYFVSPGDMVLFRSNSIHEVYSLEDSPSTHLVLQISPAQVIAFSSEEHGSSYLLRLSLSCRNDKCFWSKEECDKNGLTELFGTLIDEEKEPSRFSDFKIKLTSAQVLLKLLEEIMSCDEPSHDPDEAVSGCIYNAIVYINRFYNENITADICAKKVFMSYGHFSRSFKRVTGANFKDYLNTIRVNRAEKELIGTDDSIAEICRKCGFNTVSYFIAMFRRIKGVTPAVYREMNRNGRKSVNDTTEDEE